MLKSKFKFRALSVPILIIALTTISIVILTENLPMRIEQIRWIDVYMSILFLFTWIYLLFGIFRTQIIEITIENIQIEKKNYLGFKEKYGFQYFDGFQTSIVNSKSGNFEYLYLVKDNQKIIKISTAYHKNYSELKGEISINLKDLGRIQFCYFNEYKEVFK